MPSVDGHRCRKNHKKSEGDGVEHVEFVRRLEQCEQASGDDPQAFGRNVFGLLLLAGLWIWGNLLLGLGALAWAVLSFSDRGFRVEQIIGFFSGIALVLSVLRLTRADWQAPDGIAVPQAECPRLYEALERIRLKVGGPRIDQLVITEDYGVRVVQQVRVGGLLPARHYVLLGLPLAMAIDRPRLIALLAHEYAHLRRNNGFWGAWIYRARRRMQALHDRLADSRQMTHLGWLNERFMRWYLPRWWAASFVVARQDEWVADRIAASLVTTQLMGDALSETAVRGRWFREQFWDMHWARSREYASAMGPYSLMAGVLNHSMDVNWVYQAWKQEYQAPSGYEDTHPSLRERLDALLVPPGLTPMSSSNCLAWLGKRSARWIEILDERWCQRFDKDWQACRQVLQLMHGRAQHLMPNEPYLQANELAELGWCMKVSERREEPMPFYKRALELQPDCKRAVAAAASLHTDMDLEEQLPYLEQAYTLIPAMRTQWCATARGVLDVLEAEEHYEASIRRLRLDWQKREALAGTVQQRLQEELRDLGVLHQAKSYAEMGEALWESELAVIRLYLEHSRRLRKAWLLARPLQAVRGSHALVLVLDRPGVHYQEARQWERQLAGYLERQLLVYKLMPVLIVHLDELGATAQQRLSAVAAALVYDRTIRV